MKAMALDEGGQSLFKHAGLAADAAVVNAREAAAFVEAAKSRQWAREASVRTLA